MKVYQLVPVCDGYLMPDEETVRLGALLCVEGVGGTNQARVEFVTVDGVEYPVITEFIERG
jgi:hypothetical protein